MIQKLRELGDISFQGSFNITSLINHDWYSSIEVNRELDEVLRLGACWDQWSLSYFFIELLIVGTTGIYGFIDFKYLCNANE
jgi:hypothetical protein